ncbi:uncharacterized protein CCR75_000379 [Bremia lactucae]|uniref:Uncharacterized protein n=1 Tax=Bremia lactucae TaxID=4779 RepID=A0A976FFJ8_BRELC|nr:hypothetical protein CCR75_006765 [Bremia lactucae]TDH70407.1 hypothetical protein CCR75_000379 [Bremia lactucae]
MNQCLVRIVLSNARQLCYAVRCVHNKLELVDFERQNKVDWVWYRRKKAHNRYRVRLDPSEAIFFIEFVLSSINPKAGVLFWRSNDHYFNDLLFKRVRCKELGDAAAETPAEAFNFALRAQDNCTASSCWFVARAAAYASCASVDRSYGISANDSTAGLLLDWRVSVSNVSTSSLGNGASPSSLGHEVIPSISPWSRSSMRSVTSRSI